MYSHRLLITESESLDTVSNRESGIGAISFPQPKSELHERYKNATLSDYLACHCGVEWLYKEKNFAQGVHKGLEIQKQLLT